MTETVILSIVCICTFFGGFVLGVMTLLGLIIKRMLGSDGWDKSNMTNVLRVIGHVAMHPEDLGQMYYMTEEELKVFVDVFQTEPDKPFWYVGLDELSDVVNSRPMSTYK